MKPELPEIGACVITGDGTVGTVERIEHTSGQPRAWIVVDRKEQYYDENGYRQMRFRLQRRKAYKLRPCPMAAGTITMTVPSGGLN